MSYTPGAIQTAIVSLSASDIGNLYATPKVIVNAPGTGFFIQPLTAYFQFYPGTLQFGASSALLLGYGSQPFGPVALSDNCDVDGTTTYNNFKQPPYDNGVTVVFDNVKKNDQLAHKIGPLTLTQVAAVGALTLTSVGNPAGVGGSTTYNGTITGGAGNAYTHYTFLIAGFTNSANNGTFVCSSSTNSTLILQNANAIAETHAATATGRTSTYTGTITGFSDYVVNGGFQRSLRFTIAGFTNGANNGTFRVASTTATTLSLDNTSAVNETHAATATSQWMENQPMVVMIGDNFPEIKNIGPILSASIMAGNSGSGYAPGDTGDIDDGGTGTFAHYTVNTVNGGTGIATFTLNSGGCNSPGAMGYSLNQGYSDTNASGAGSGAVFVPQTVQAGNGIARMVVTYTILPI